MKLKWKQDLPWHAALHQSATAKKPKDSSGDQ